MLLVNSFTDILLLTFIIQFFYWVYFFLKLALYTSKPLKKEPESPVSVIVCTKNDLPFLQKNILSWLGQDYSFFELLVVDDFSGIETKHFIDKMKQTSGHLSYHKVITNKAGKKQALKEAFSVSKNAWVLLTDADCSPATDLWIKTMVASAHSNQSKIVLGYSPYLKVKNTFLNNWIHFEAWMTGVMYLSFTLRKMPYMGVGRNLLYNKEIITSDILEKNADVISGDDDLLVNQISTPANTSICIDPRSFCYSFPKQSWKEYGVQKLRHYSTPTRYKLRHQILLGGFSVSQIAFFLLLVYGLFNVCFTICLAFYLIRLLFVLPIAYCLIQKLNGHFSLLRFLIFDFFLAVFYFVFALSFLLPNRKSW